MSPGCHPLACLATPRRSRFASPGQANACRATRPLAQHSPLRLARCSNGSGARQIDWPTPMAYTQLVSLHMARSSRHLRLSALAFQEVLCSVREPRPRRPHALFLFFFQTLSRVLRELCQLVYACLIHGWRQCSEQHWSSMAQNAES